MNFTKRLHFQFAYLILHNQNHSPIKMVTSKSKIIYIHPDPGFKTTTSWIQIFYGVWVNLTLILVGMAYGFITVLLQQLSSPTSHLTVTMHELSWIASVLYLACPLGCLFSGIIMDRFGRRIALIVCEVPLMVGWIVTGVAYTLEELIAGRIIVGVGCGMAMCVPRLYTTEISLPNMRGVIGAFPFIGISFGFCLQGVLGAVLDWHIISHICTAFSVILMIIYIFLPESPHYVLLKYSEESVEASLKQFRAKGYNLDSEMKNMMDFKTDNEIRRLTFGQQIIALFNASACKPFSIIIIYFVITHCSGSSIMIVYATEILKKTKSDIDPYLGNILLGIIRIVSGIILSYLLFKYFRKSLAIIGAVGVGLCCVAIGQLCILYVPYTDTPMFLPILLYVFCTVFMSISYSTLPFLIMAEMYPLQVRGLLCGISLSILNGMLFGAIKLYPYLLEAIGIANTFFVFGASSLFGSVYLFFFLPETKGLTLHEIEEYFNKRSPTLISQRQIMSEQLLSKANESQIRNKSVVGLKRSTTLLDGNIVDFDQTAGTSSKKLGDQSTNKLNKTYRKNNN